MIFRIRILRFSGDRLFDLRLEYLLQNQFRYVSNRQRLILGGAQSDRIGMANLGNGLPVDHTVDEIDCVAVRGEGHQDSAVADVLIALIHVLGRRGLTDRQVEVARMLAIAVHWPPKLLLIWYKMSESGYETVKYKRSDGKLPAWAAAHRRPALLTDGCADRWRALP